MNYFVAPNFLQKKKKKTFLFCTSLVMKMPADHKEISLLSQKGARNMSFKLFFDTQISNSSFSLQVRIYKGSRCCFVKKD